MDINNHKQLVSTQLRQIFVHHLNRVYFGKRFLNQNFEKLVEMASFNNLKLALQEMWQDVKNQIIRMEDIYALLEEKPSDEHANPIKSIVQDDFFLDQVQPVPVLKDIDIILYVQLLEHINITSYRMLKMLAGQIKNKKIDQLLIECFDESVDDDGLFVLIAKEYIAPRS